MEVSHLPSFWIMKSEPTTYSIDHLMKDKKTHWEGIRNYQARNYMRDVMKIGDHAFFYHSNAKTIGIFGEMRIISKPYPDHTQFDENSPYYDPCSSLDNPRWVMVDVEFLSKYDQPLLRNEMKKDLILAQMDLFYLGRLSITLIKEPEWKQIYKKLGRSLIV